MRNLVSPSGVVALVLLGCAPALAADQMHWQPNLEAAQRVAAQTNRLILIHFWAPWCAGCIKLDREVFADPTVGQSLEANFVPVKLNVDEAPSTARLYGVSRLPADVVVTPAGQLVAQINSPNTTGQYVAQLNQIAAGHRNLKAPAAALAAQQPALGGPPIQQQLAQQPAIQQQPGQQSIAQQPPIGAGPPAMASQPKKGPNAASNGAYSDDRYAEYFQQQPSQAQAAPPAGLAPNAAPTATNPQIAAAIPSIPQGVINPTPGAQNNAFAPPAVSAPAPRYGDPPFAAAAQTPTVAPQGSFAPPAVGPQNSLAAPAPGQPPPLGLDGYCPVQLSERMQWTQGDRRWGAIHRGRTYLFAGPEEQKRFLANPDFYSPVISGNDPVAALDHGQTLPGRREFGAQYDRRVYLFSSEESLQRFRANPNRYAAEVLQAMR